MYVLIVGCGRMGSELALMLSDEGHDIVLIDQNPNSFKKLGHAFNGMTITGNGFNCEILEEAGIKEAHALAAVTDEDNVNIIAVQIAKEIYHVPIAVARVYDPQKASTYKHLGLEIVSTTTVMARMFRDRFVEKQVQKYLLSHQERVEMYNVEVKGSLIGRKIKELTHPGVFMIITVTDKGRMTLPLPEYVLTEGDTFLGVGSVNERDNVHTIIWGGSAL